MYTFYKKHALTLLFLLSCLFQGAQASQAGLSIVAAPEAMPQNQSAYNTAVLLGAAATTIALGTVAYGYNSYLKYKNPKLKIWQDPVVQRLLKEEAEQAAIFDMGGVLVTIDKTGMGLDKIGKLGFARYLIGHLRSPSFIKKEVMRLYNEPTGTEKLSAEEEKLKKLFSPFSDVRNYDGTPLPQLITIFQAGLLPSAECLEIIKKRSDDLYAKKQYKSLEEKNIILTLASTTFEPQWFADHTKAIPDGVELLRRFANNGDMPMILSNWDKESFAIMKKKFRDIFDRIEPENIFVSGEVHLLKPSKEIFELVMKKAGCSSDKKCVFFDDQEENIKGAEACGLHAIPCVLG
jgi:HAD superfamily hydrolase (TIGR01509 family)